MRRSVAPHLLLVLSALIVTGCTGEAVEGDEAGDGQEASLVRADGSVDWSVYHSTAETHRIMRELEALHPDLVELETIGESIHGQELLVAKITNSATGPDHEKPAVYVDGGIHARELTGSEVALHWMVRLLDGYGDDPRITRLLDTRAFYVHPKFNPDGSDLVLEEDAFLRSTPRPVDLDEDGIPDGDPPEDLTGDGRILQMRVPDADGGWVVDSADPRIMQERTEADEGPFYTLLTEGVDRDGDGALNDDGLGGIDMNRNWPRNWERWHLQDGAGDFPLSEPETHAVAHFLNRHRNVSLILHGHTSGGFVYRLPSAMDPAAFDENDEALVIHLADFYTEDTGRPIRPSAVHPVNRRYGTLIQWAYSDFGAVGYVPEFSPSPEAWVPDSDGDGVVDETDWHRFNDEEFDGRYFQDWEPYEHPQLGDVEIGGWWRLFWGQNPPHLLLESELETQMPWYLHLAERTPLLELDPPVVRAVEAAAGGPDGTGATTGSLGEAAAAATGEDAADASREVTAGSGVAAAGRYVVEVTIRNTGFLPTNVTERGLVGLEAEDGTVRWQVARAPLVVLEAEGARVVDGSARRRIGHLAGESSFSAGVTDRERTVRFELERGADEASFRVTVHGEKGGTFRSERVVLR